MPIDNGKYIGEIVLHKFPIARKFETPINHARNIEFIDLYTQKKKKKEKGNGNKNQFKSIYTH